MRIFNVNLYEEMSIEEKKRIQINQFISSKYGSKKSSSNFTETENLVDIVEYQGVRKREDQS